MKHKILIFSTIGSLILFFSYLIIASVASKNQKDEVVRIVILERFAAEGVSMDSHGRIDYGRRTGVDLYAVPCFIPKKGIVELQNKAKRDDVNPLHIQWMATTEETNGQRAVYGYTDSHDEIMFAHGIFSKIPPGTIKTLESMMIKTCSEF